MRNKFTYEFASWLLIRLIGLIFLIAFFSFAQQWAGLVGSDGITPVGQTLVSLNKTFGSHSIIHRPSLFWLGHSDPFIQSVAWCGLISSLLIVCGICSNAALLICWFSYLSVVNVAPVFFSFQWDSMLLECGLLGLFFRPWQWFDNIFDKANLPSPVMPQPTALRTYNNGVLWLYRWLLFRVMFCSGVIKITHNCDSWINFTALSHFYETQLLPNPLAWYLHQAPMWFHSCSAAGMYVAELIVPLLIFVPLVPKWLCAAVIALTQVFMFSTGNHGFINLLTAALCVTLIDDDVWKRLLPGKLVKLWTKNQPIAALVQRTQRTGKFTETILVAFLTFTGVVAWNRMFPTMQFSAANELAALLDDGFHLTGNYGLYPTVFDKRTEVVIEGSNDGSTWAPYEFRWHVGDTNRALPIVAPLQPRLDWMMRFAALQPSRECPWFDRFIDKLLSGSPTVLALLEKGPFGYHPPKFIRADVYQYAFTNSTEHSQTNKWWKRKLIARYTDSRSISGGSTTCLDRKDLILWDSVRRERFAGSWYPASKLALQSTVRELMHNAESQKSETIQFFGKERPVADDLLALMIPHAGFGYSGSNAASAYLVAKASAPKRIILLGPYHNHDRPHDSGGSYGALITEDITFATPIGELPVDHVAIKSLTKERYFAIDDDAQRREHSLELQTPFIRQTFGCIPIVPILVANLDNQIQAKSIAQSISKIMRKGDLIIASCDMNHCGKVYGYTPPGEQLKKSTTELDRQAYSLLSARDVDGLWKSHNHSSSYICGFPVQAVLINLLPSDAHATGLAYYTSQDTEYKNVPKERRRCVGYLAAAFSRKQTGMAQETTRYSHKSNLVAQTAKPDTR